MIETQLGADGLVLVTFHLPHAAGAQTVAVVGEFNDWSVTATPMEYESDGYVARLRLRPGRAYRFRYLLDGERWENDWAAHRYEPNEYGGEDSVIDLTDVAVPPHRTSASLDGGGLRPVTSARRGSGLAAIPPPARRRKPM